MTCIVGLVDEKNGKVYMGADSAGVALASIEDRKDRKIFKVGKRFLIGFTGSFRMGQILRFYLNPPPIRNLDLYKYMCTNFVCHVIKVLTDNSHAKIESNEISCEGTILIAVKKRLFFMDKDFQIGEHNNGYHAIGSGESEALGALYALNDIKLDPEIKIRRALEASEQFNTCVRRPFIIERI